MSRARDNWERLVSAVVKRDQIWQLFHAHSRSPSINTSISTDTDSDFSPPYYNFQEFSVSLRNPVLRTDLSSFPQEEIKEALKRVVIFRHECGEVGKQVEHLWQMLRSVNDIAMSTPTFYARPFNVVATDASICFHQFLTIVKKCRRHNNPLRRLVHITSVSTHHFTKLVHLLDSSLADMMWLLRIYKSGAASGHVLRIPPIAHNDPVLAWVWAFISALYVGQLRDKIEVANELASLAKDNDRYKRIIVEEGGILPLVKMLKDGSSTEGQIAAASALYTLANDSETVEDIIGETGVPVIVQFLIDSPMKVKIRVVNLVAKMAEHCPLALEDFGRVLIRSLVTLLFDDSNLKYGKKKNVGNENPEVKVRLKISCAEALWMLTKGNVANCRIIAETEEGLFCLAKLVETEERELQYNCLMTIIEITTAVESNNDFRRVNSLLVAKAVVDQLLRLMKDSDEPRLRIAAIRAVGSLARVFPVGETRVIGSLVEQLSHGNQDVAIEAAISLGKFANHENILCVEHSKSIIEFKGVPPLMRLLRGNETAQLHGCVLICYLAIHADDLKLKRTQVAKAFEGVIVGQNPQLKKLIAQALYRLSLFP